MAEPFIHSHIRNMPLFEQLSPPQIGVIASIAQVQRYEPGQLVFQEGQKTQGLMLFVSGRGILTRRSPTTGTEDSIGSVEAGHYIGEAALYSTGVETASLRIVETAIVVLIPRAPFVQLITQYPEIRANIRVQTGTAQARETANRLFKGQRSDETVLQVWRRHWWAVAQHSWIAVAVAVVMFAIALVIAGQAPILALGAAGLAVVIPGIIVAYLYYDWQDDSVVLSDQRVVRIWHQLIRFETTINEIPLDQILEVNMTVPPADVFARIFQYGTVTVHAAGQGVDMTLDLMPNPLSVQSMIFTQRDRFKERAEQHQRDSVLSDVQAALGIVPDQQPGSSTSGQQQKSSREANIGLGFLRTKFLAANGDLIYRKHSSVWMVHVFLPGLVILGALFLMLLSLFPNSPLSGGVGLGAGMFALIGGALWFYAADWDWRNDLFIIGTDTITFIRQRPLWLQNQVDRIRISQIDNVRSEVHGFINNIINRGNVRISLIGTDLKYAKVMDSIFDPQEVQAEISRRHSALKSDKQISDIDQQREVIKEYLQTYDQIKQTQQVAQVGIPPAPPTQPIYTAAPTYPQQAAAETEIPPLPHDNSRPPGIPHSRPE